MRRDVLGDPGGRNQPTARAKLAPAVSRMNAEPQVYGRAYYETHCGEAYERTPHWLNFFGKVADHLVSDIGPHTALDAGCAMGFLVESLRDRGVEAEGVDISQYAVSLAREDMRSHVRVGSLLEPLERRWDLITCIEVLEHLEAADVETAIANLCEHTDDIFFSSTPRDFRESSHVNVRPPEYWMTHFLRHGFVRDLDFDGSFLTPWAVRVRRRRDPLERTVAAYERELWRLLEEKVERDRVVMEQVAELAERIEVQERLQQEREVLQRERDWFSAEAARLGMDVRDADAQLREAREAVAHLAHTNAALRAEVDSIAFRMAQRARRVVHRVAPDETARREALSASLRAAVSLRRSGPLHVARRALTRASASGARLSATRRTPALESARTPPLSDADLRWNQFITAHEPSAPSLERMRVQSRAWSDRPLVSVLMPAYRSAPWFLRAAIDSVRAQAYENWELCIADDASPGREVADTAAHYGHDSRIHFVRREENGGIAAASNSAAEMAQGDYIAFLDHDDVLAPHALYQMVRHFLAHPEDDLVYSDEDKLDEFGRRVQAFLKPDWSPELLEACNYVSHLTVMRRRLFDGAGKFRPGFDGSQDYDLLLRATEKTRHVGHLAEVLYSWRMVPGSAALALEAKPAAYAAGARALESAVERRGENSWVGAGRAAGIYQVRRAVAGSPSVAVVIPTRDRLELLVQAVACAEAERGPRDVRIVIVDNDSADPRTLAYLARCGHTVTKVPGVFNFSRVVNRGAEAAGTVDHILLLNNDIVTASLGWIDAMLEHSQRPEVGAVGARLLLPDGRVQHEGDRLGGGGGLANNLDLSGYFNMGLCTRTVSAVTGACLMIKRSVWEGVGGFDERLRVIFNDVDFCLRVQQAGYRNVYTPFAELTHALSASRGGHHPTEDCRLFTERWHPERLGADPYIGAHLNSLQPVTYV